jgi:hypothetical protein
MTWEYGQTKEFDAWFESLTDEEQLDVVAYIELLEEEGPMLKYPACDVIKSSRHFSKLKELRVSSTGGDRLRVFYAFDPNRKAILLIGGNKTGKWIEFYEEFIPIADGLFERHLSAIKKSKGA